MSTPMQMKKLTLAAGIAALAITTAACGPGLDRAVKVLVTSPDDTVEAGEPLGLVATIQSNQNETIEPYEGNVTVRLAAGTHPDALSGTLTVKAVKGVATFSDVALTKVGTGYRISVKAETVPGTREIADQVVGPVTVEPGPAAGIGVLDQPSKSAPNGIVFPFPRVAVTDAFGNVVTDSETTVTVSLENNPSGATLSGTLTRQTTGSIAVFDDLSVNNLGAGYTLRFTATGANATSAAFDVVQPRLVYTDPPEGGTIRVVRNAASTDSVVVLDVVAAEAFTGYAVGFTLPADPRTVVAGSPLISNVGGLNPGTSPAAFGAALPTTGRMAGFLTAGISQKASGAGAVTTDTAVAAGTVLFTLRLEMAQSPLFKEAFDGATLGHRFEAAIRNRAGDDVVPGLNFRFGRLAVE